MLSFRVLLLTWAIKESKRSLGLPKGFQVLGASMVFLAQGLPKAGEGTAIN